MLYFHNIDATHIYTFSIKAAFAKTMSKIDQNLKSGQLVILKVDTFSGPEEVCKLVSLYKELLIFFWYGVRVHSIVSHKFITGICTRTSYLLLSQPTVQSQKFENGT